MDFTFAPEHVQLRETVRRFAGDEMMPLAAESDDAERFPKHLFRRWGELGLLGARYPEEDGGVGMDKVSDCIIREELARVSQAFCAAYSAHSHLGIWPIWRAGTEMQKAQYFRPALAGEKVACFGLSEPDGGSNIRAMKTRAEKVEGGYRVNGAKLYITNSPLADFMLLAARTAPDLKPWAISLFIVPLPNPAVHISHLKKEGLKGSETGLLAIEDLFVPDDHVLGEREGTYPVILDSLTENRVGVAASVLGLAKGAYEEALDYARTRIVAGRPILQYQAVAHRLADMVTDIEAAHWMVYHGAWRVDQGTIDHAAAAKIKLFASEAALRVTEGAMRVLGGASIMREYSVGRHHRDALVYLFGEGTSDVQRNLISRSMGEFDLLPE
ncbi:MAG: acyl-CoA dehydrogenase family protein [Alphaproteobacteria bacterium]|nr:acyl-CoA dehydrogenase family protein [Alphaproteobacteria bacterium]MCB9931449.1 acyl-CoA dehydrogenase family protein [Alphaproteobacteria bacterium]